MRVHSWVAFWCCFVKELPLCLFASVCWCACLYVYLCVLTLRVGNTHGFLTRKTKYCWHKFSSWLSLPFTFFQIYNKHWLGLKKETENDSRGQWSKAKVNVTSSSIFIAIYGELSEGLSLHLLQSFSWTQRRNDCSLGQRSSSLWRPKPLTYTTITHEFIGLKWQSFIF